jgi:hypothetical protein
MWRERDVFYGAPNLFCGDGTVGGGKCGVEPLLVAGATAAAAPAWCSFIEMRPALRLSTIFA